MTNPIAIELKAMCARLCELFPECRDISLSAKRYDDVGLKDDQSVTFHRVGDYQATTALLSRIGIGDRRKSVHGENTTSPWSTLRGEAEGVGFLAFADTIPPSCRIETTTRRIPKTQTVDTGEFIEVQERVVKCGHGEAVA